MEGQTGSMEGQGGSMEGQRCMDSLNINLLAPNVKRQYIGGARR